MRNQVNLCRSLEPDRLCRPCGRGELSIAAGGSRSTTIASWVFPPDVVRNIQDANVCSWQIVDFSLNRSDWSVAVVKPYVVVERRRALEWALGAEIGNRPIRRDHHAINKNKALEAEVRLAKVWMAERQGFEPWRQFPAYTRSRRAPSTTRPPLRGSDNTLCPPMHSMGQT